MVPVSEFARWSDTYAFPQIPTRAAFRVWRKIKQHPRFDGPTTPDGGGGGGGSVQCRATSTQRQTVTDSSTTTVMALPPSLRIPRNPRQGPVHERRWRFRPIREFDATHDRFRFMNDDGAAYHATLNENQ